MKKNNHLLQRVIFEIGTPRQEGAFEIQNRISNAFSSSVLSRLEVLFDTHLTTEQVVTIDRLEFNFGRIDSNNLEETLSDAFEKEFDHLLVSILQEINNANGSSSDSYQFKIRLPQNGALEFEASISISSETTSRFDQLKSLLEFGIALHSSPQSENYTIQNLLAKVLLECPEQFAAYIQHKRFQPIILSRLVLNANEEQLKFLAKLFNCPFHETLPELIKRLVDFCNAASIKQNSLAGTSGSIYADMTQTIWAAILNEYIRTTDSESIPQNDILSQEAMLILRTIFRGKSSLQAMQSLDEKKWDHLARMSSGILKAIVEELRNEYAINSSSDSNKHKQRNSRSQHTKTSEFARLVMQHIKVLDERETVPSIATTPESDSHNLNTVLESGIYIRNAGLIILAPYLNPFFANLGLLHNKKFVSTEASWQAVHLLQYATGLVRSDETGSWSEQDLVFNKILCGIEINDPVPEHLVLTEESKSEVTTLLSAVLQNWPLLKRTSIPNLQISFLQKQGKLKKTGADWEMLVERDSAVEILIDKLPWGISMVKLPWNEYTIQTQW